MIMKRIITLAITILGLYFAAYAQTPTYISKSLKPTAEKFYEVESSIDIHGGETWKNVFTLWDEGNATFEWWGEATFGDGHFSYSKQRVTGEQEQWQRFVKDINR